MRRVRERTSKKREIKSVRRGRERMTARVSGAPSLKGCYCAAGRPEAPSGDGVPILERPGD